MSNNDEPTKDELEQRVEQLEATVQKMLPNRRQTLTGLGLLAGGGLLGGSASGSTGAAGDIGTPNDRPTSYLDEVRDQNDDQLVNYDASGVNFQVPVSTGRLVNGPIFAGNQNGADVEARLDNALSAAADGDTIILENATYSQNRSFGFDGKIVGSGQLLRGTEISADWTLNGSTTLRDISWPGSITHDGGFADVTKIQAATITINNDGVGVFASFGVDVTFSNGVDRGIADGLYGNSSANDNDGRNRIGDVN